MLDLETIARDRAARMAQWRDRGLYADYTYGDALRDGAARHGDVRLVFHSKVRPAATSVRDAYAATERLASAFHHLGLKRGDRIAVMLPTWFDATLAYVAALKLGVAVVPIVAIYGAREIGFILRQTEAKALVIPDLWRGHDYVERVSAAGDLPALKHLIVVGGRRPGTIAWDDLLAHSGVDYPHEAQADDLSCIIYTSGTTADPKGVKHTHNTQLCDVNAVRAGLVPTPAVSAAAQAPEGPALSVFPAGHVASFLAMLRPFLQGGEAVFMDQWVPEDAARLIERYKVASSVGTPIFLSSLLKAAEETGADISTLKRFGLGASAITPENVRWTDQLGFPSGRIYGMTEHPVVSSAAGDSFEKRAYTDGRITPFNEVRIVDDDGADVPVGQVGEVCTRGPRLFMGYVDPELDRQSFLEGGWYKSGDIGRMDAEGYLTITDRKKDIIIRGGENISSKEVEDILATAPGVIESAVTAMPDPEMGERVCAFLVLRPGAVLTLEDVRGHFSGLGITRQKTPERVIVVDDLPRTSSGKVKKGDLREQLRAEAKAIAVG
ncbi:MAG: fadK [Phenylobacterium sp.]|nr:fadK [Phenylobacterium sp.]